MAPTSQPQTHMIGHDEQANMRADCYWLFAQQQQQRIGRMSKTGSFNGKRSMRWASEGNNKISSPIETETQEAPGAAHTLTTKSVGEPPEFSHAHQPATASLLPLASSR